MQIIIGGILLQASLILTLGAQNLFLIDTSIKKNNHFLAAGVCTLCDVILIFFGIFSVSEFIASSPWFKVIVSVIGALFLLSYGFIKLSEAFSNKPMDKKYSKKKSSKRQIILTTLGFTLLNPHVYLETVFVIGGISTKYSTQLDKILFGLGAGGFSLIWFYFLAIFSSHFSTFLSHQKNLRIVSFVTGGVLCYLGAGLGLEVLK